MQCLIYARVSTDKQAEKKLSIPAPLEAMRDYARNHHWEIAEEFIEAGVSARTAGRKELRRLLARCHESQSPVQVVVVHKLDRLARNVAAHVGIRTILYKLNVKLVSVTDNLDESVSGQLVEHIMAAIPELYSANLGDEVQKGLRQKVAQGGWPHQPPRGYRVTKDGDRSQVTIDPEQGPLVRKMFDLILSGYSGLQEFRLRLARLGLRT